MTALLLPAPNWKQQKYAPTGKRKNTLWKSPQQQKGATDPGKHLSEARGWVEETRLAGTVPFASSSVTGQKSNGPGTALTGRDTEETSGRWKCSGTWYGWWPHHCLQT